MTTNMTEEEIQAEWEREEALEWKKVEQGIALLDAAYKRVTRLLRAERDRKLAGQRASETQHKRLAEAAKTVKEVLYLRQYEWNNVLKTYSPEWTLWLHNAIEALEAALKAEEEA